MCILSTLSALNSIENYWYHTEYKMDSMHIGMQAMIDYILCCDGGKKLASNRFKQLICVKNITA